MLQLPADLSFFYESLEHLGFIFVFVEQDLDSQIASQIGVASLDNRAHAATCDFTMQLIAAIGLFGRELLGPKLNNLTLGLAIFTEQDRGSIG